MDHAKSTLRMEKKEIVMTIPKRRPRVVQQQPHTVTYKSYVYNLFTCHPETFNQHNGTICIRGTDRV